ncbi:MAG: hypothetical protein LIR50_04860 [Bacillota bacterium]|nr:hypothetical protein [Bacillota bacterium]
MKDYLCKDCVHNNNGWCEKKKFNGLKKMDIAKCADKKFVVEEKQNDNITSKINIIGYKNFGKREEFYNIQRQIEAMDENSNIADVKQIMVNLGQMLDIEEQIQGITIEYEIDQNIIDGSKNLNNKWLREIGGYKGGIEIK